MNKNIGAADPAGFTGVTVFLPAVCETESFLNTFLAIRENCRAEDIREVVLVLYTRATEDCVKTAEKITELGADFPIKTVRDNGNVKQSIEMLVSIANGSHFVFQPSDLEIDASYLGDMIEELKRQPQKIVTGSRAISEKGLKDCIFIKRLLSKPFNLALNLLYGTKTTDATLLFTILPTDAVRKLKLTCESYTVLFEMMLKLIRLGTGVAEVPVTYRRRTEGKSNTKIIPEALRYIQVTLSVRASRKKDFLIKL